MPNVGIVASAVVPHIPNKAAVWPGDVYVGKDALMPAWVTQSYDKATMLTYCGFFPDPLYVDVWQPGQKITYDGSSYYWTGSVWKDNLPSGPVVLTKSSPRTITADYLGYTDFSRMSIARRSINLGRLCTPSPTSAWAPGETACVTQNNLNSPALGHIVRWDGTQWEFVVTSPEFTGNAWSKVLTPGCEAMMDPNITLADTTNANKLAGLGYTMSPSVGAPGLLGYSAAVTFPSPTASYTLNRFYWNGTAWQVTYTTNFTYYGTTSVHAGIAALPSAQRAWAAGGYTTAGVAEYLPWTPSMSATVAGEAMYGQKTGAWALGVSPGTTPPTPASKTALLPGDIYSTVQTGAPAPTNGATGWGYVVSYYLTGGGFRPHSSERFAWRAPNNSKYIRYLNTTLWWDGSRWISSAVGMDPTAQRSQIYATGVSTYDLRAGQGCQIGSLVPADRLAAADAYHETYPLTAWGADAYTWLGNCMLSWNGTGWTMVATAPTIHEAATFPCQPGDLFVDTRVTAQNATIAGNLLSYGYVPVLRSAWFNQAASPVTPPYIQFMNPTTFGATPFQYSWNGTAWAAGIPAATGTLVAPGAVVTDAMISALPANEQIVACSLAGYYSNTGAHWTSGQSATIGGNVVHWHGASARRYWAPGAAP